MEKNRREFMDKVKPGVDALREKYGRPAAQISSIISKRLFVLSTIYLANLAVDQAKNGSSSIKMKSGRNIPPRIPRILAPWRTSTLLDPQAKHICRTEKH